MIHGLAVLKNNILILIHQVLTVFKQEYQKQKKKQEESSSRELAKKYNILLSSAEGNTGLQEELANIIVVGGVPPYSISPVTSKLENKAVGARIVNARVILFIH